MSNIPTPGSVRDTLFGDMPWEVWGKDSDIAPWAQFAEARRQRDAGETAEAAELLQVVVATPELESRHYVQAWHFLRELGYGASAKIARTVYGVIVEVGLEQGTDIVAGYADHSARYYNFSGAAVAWEHPNGSMDEKIDRLLAVGSAVAERIGPWEDARPGPPEQGEVRLSFLTPSGLCFGQGPFGALLNDPMGGPVIGAALNLMKALMGIAKGE